jgi:hypothetical protein
LVPLLWGKLILSACICHDHWTSAVKFINVTTIWRMG